MKNAAPENVDEILAKNRQEIHGPTIAPEKLMEDIGAVPLHQDKNGIYFCKFLCKNCGTEHTANINIEERLAVIEVKKQKGAA